ncbi:MAG: IclR family transcriptional regulator [Actinomycetota bacterium]|nr:IclR family transcriptional regulator [Actinomycetota bacterium]
MPGPIQSIERAAAILRLLAQGPGRLGLAEIASSLQLAKGTAHGILRTLGEVGFVEQDATSGKYQMGAVLLDLGSGFIDINELRARSLNWADPLAARTGETVRLGVLLSAEVLVVHHVFRPDDSPQTANVGALLPAHATALGKVLLAYHPKAAALISGELAAFTSRTITDRTQLGHELADAREKGYAVESGEYAAGQASIAAPIYGYGGLMVAAVAIHGDPDRLCDTKGQGRPRMIAQVRDCARSITRDLGKARVAR